MPGTLPTAIEVRGARHNNLHDLDVDVPLWRTVAIVGVSGSGKTSLAIGTLYAEGMHRFLAALSTYSRRRLTQAQRPDVDRIGHLPPALALRQRPPVPGPRSTVGTMTEVLNILRLMMSRLGSKLCPNGHRVEPSVATQDMEIVCPVCGVHFEAPSAESFSFNSYGACPACNGLGVRSEVDVDTLVPDQGKTIEQGAVLPWNAGSRRLYQYAARELGVRLDVPFRELTRREREIVLHGEPVQRRVTFSSGRSGRPVQLNVTYENAIATVERALRSDTEVSRGRVRRFLVIRTCSVCHGTRLRPEALTSLLGGRNMAQISALRLDELHSFVAGLPGGLPAELGRLTAGLIGELNGTLTPLLDVGLGYLQLDRSGASLSAGERQRIELTSTVRKYHRHALRARRAVRWAAPQQHRGPARHDRRTRPERQFRRHRGARAGNHAHGGLDHRARPRRRGSWRHHHRRGHPGRDRGRSALDHGPVSRRDGHRPAGPGRAVRPPSG